MGDVALVLGGFIVGCIAAYLAIGYMVGDVVATSLKKLEDDGLISIKRGDHG